MKKTSLSVLIITAFSFSNAIAATATINSTAYQTRAIDTVLDNTDYMASWNAQTSTVTSQDLADFNGVSSPWSASGEFSHLKVNFTTGIKTNTSFLLAPDAGFGGAIYVDGNLIASNTADLWWGFDWNNTSQILAGMVNNLKAGDHTFEGYWAETCCNGGQGLQIVATAATPVPAAAWLFGSAIVTLAGVRSRKKQLG
ncbi:MAG: CCXG family PEP-CTERM protein [Methyloglobulus sp.]|nr:hypothetical protein [Methyloglobulus sp.]